MIDFFATIHNLSDLIRLCERVLIIDLGKILYDGSLADLLSSFGGQRVLRVDFAEYYPKPILQNADIVQREGSTVVYSFKRQNISASKLINLFSSEYRISNLSIQDQPIEDTIREIYEKKLLYNHPYGKKNTSS